MALFRCKSCKAVYYDYYPPDDSCLKCHAGTIPITEPDHEESGFAISKEEHQ